MSDRIAGLPFPGGGTTRDRNRQRCEKKGRGKCSKTEGEKDKGLKGEPDREGNASRFVRRRQEHD